MAHDRVRFNVGGKKFVTSRATIENGGRNSMLAAMIDSLWQKPADSDEKQEQELFIDRNPVYFSVLLDLLRTGELHIPTGMSERALFREALYYGILDHVRDARSGPLDGNRVVRTASIRGCATGDGTAIRANAEGGCCVAHEAMVHVYDWTLEQQAPLTLDYVNVNDVAFMGTRRVVIGTCDRGELVGGMASFDVSSGDIVHRYRVSHDGHLKNFSAVALATSEDRHVFASCRGRSNEHGIGTWDQNTGQQVQFFYEEGGWPLGDASKLQWLPHSKLLLVATLFPSDDSCICLLDLRAKGKAWSWTDSDGAILGVPDEKVVMDAVAMEDSSTVCVVNQFDHLGFIDVRVGTTQALRWSHRGQPTKIPDSEERCYSRLAYCGSQLFASKHDHVSVLCSPNWETARSVQTAKLNKTGGGGIADISVGGDRLFVLHNEEDVFDVWETPHVSSK